MNTHIVSLVDIQIRVHVPFVCSPDRSSHAWPRLLERKHALDVVSVYLLARDWIDDGRLNAEEGKRS
jgi:hypothetical protein